MFTDFQIERNGTKLYCRKIGSGEPILMIHGGGTDCDFFGKSAELLSKHFEVFIYDRRGYGRNDEAVDGDYKISTQAEDAQSIIHYIGKLCYVFAHSYGGLVAFELAKIEKELIKEFIIFEPPAYEGVDVKVDTEVKKEMLILIQEGKYQEAIGEFAKFFGPSDSRQKVQTSEELQKTYFNLVNFLKNEYTLEAYNIAHQTLLDCKITFCVGEISKNTDLGIGTINLANRLEKELVYFPGQHNGPYDLPKEFSCLFYGLLSL